MTSPVPAEHAPQGVLRPTERPAERPADTCFSSGPTTKFTGWSLQDLSGAVVGRSHRSAEAVARIREVLDLSREVLGIPEDHRVAIVPASDTGAVEMALWNLVGPRPVEVLAWDSFGADWVTDLRDQLPVEARAHVAEHGHLPDLGEVDFSHDVVLTWNGTTAGVRLPGPEVIPAEHEGLVICDATSAVFAMDLPWDRLDVVTWSWQKVLGGEAAHGMLVLSPRAVERLREHVPPWPVPKALRLASGGVVNEGLFAGSVLNTPSMLAVEDAVVAMRRAREIGLPELMARSERSAGLVYAFAEERDWVEPLPVDPATRSTTSVCLRWTHPEVAGDAEFAAAVVARLADEGVALDVQAYRTAPPGLRIWCGATVETQDVAALLPWVEWAFHTELAARSGAGVTPSDTPTRDLPTDVPADTPSDQEKTP
ncbi:phosphoserine transaminase [Kytococcus sedentarius]|uniref:phosphoserine transaminase n=1 Tax=Kytococcus sedentarius TaxID=1276 RepID=UPI0035BBBC41